MWHVWLGQAVAFQQEHNPDFWRTICECLSNLDMFGDWTSTFQRLGTLHERVPVLVCWGDEDEVRKTTHAHTLRPWRVASTGVPDTRWCM